MARTSFGSTLVSTGPTAAESLGTMIVPLLFLLGNCGRFGTGAWMVCVGGSLEWSTEDAEDESDRSMGGVLVECSASSMIGA